MILLGSAFLTVFLMAVPSLQLYAPSTPLVYVSTESIQLMADSTGAPTLLTQANQIPKHINVREYGAKGDGITDDSAAFGSAISAANISAGQVSGINFPACIYIPSGLYRIAHNQLPTFFRNGCVIGDGSLRSILSIDPSYAGDLFSWSEAWMGKSYPFNGQTLDVLSQAAGPVIRGLSIVGNRSASSPQNAIVFYDRNDFISVEDISIYYLKGRALFSGVTKNSTEAFIRESRFRDLRFFNVGDENLPVVEFNSQGKHDSSNEINIENLDIYGPYGPGFSIRNANASTPISGFKISRLRIEGMEGNPANVKADLLTIGDPYLPGAVNGIRLAQIELIDPYENFAAIRLTASTPQLSPYHVFVEGVIGGGKSYGQGLRIDAGRKSYFHFADIHTIGPQVIVAAAPMTGPGIAIDGDGAEQTWTYKIDSTALNYISTPMRKFGNPNAPVDLGLPVKSSRP
jgi:Pectate lyase superfamily protein